MAAEVPLEPVETLGPESSIWLDPGVDLLSGPGRSRYIRRWASHPDIDETGVAQHPEVLRDGGLTHRQPVDELTDGPLTVAQQVEDAATSRLGEELEGCDHAAEYACIGYMPVKSCYARRHGLGRGYGCEINGTLHPRIDRPLRCLGHRVAARSPWTPGSSLPCC